MCDVMLDAEVKRADGGRLDTAVACLVSNLLSWFLD